MHLGNVLRRTVSKRFHQRCISSGCQYTSKFKINVPQFHNVVRATSHSKGDFLKLREHISFLYGRICAFQPAPGHPTGCFISFRDKGAKYHALNAVVKNYTFEPIYFPCEHALYPCIAVVSISTRDHSVRAVIEYIKEKAGHPDSFDYIVQKSDVMGDKTLNNIFFTFRDPEVFKRVVPNHSVHQIPGENVQSRKIKEENPDRSVKDALLYSYLPLYLDLHLSTMINTLVIEWDKFKQVDCAVIFNIFETLGSVKSFESAGKNQVLVHFDKIHQSPLFSAFTQQSLLGKALLVLSPKEGWKAKVHVHIPRSEDNPLVEKKLLPFILRNSVTLHNVEPHCSDMDNVNFVGGLLNRVDYNPGFISATYIPDERKMEVLLEHAAYVDTVVDVVNRRGGEISPVFRNIKAEPSNYLSNEDSITAEAI